MCRHCPSHCSVRTLAGIPGENLPAQTHISSAVCATAIYQPPKTPLQLLKQIYFLIKFWSSTPEQSQSHLPWAVKQNNLKHVGISSILISGLSFLGIFEFFWNEHHSWAPSCWHPSSSRTVFPVTHTGRRPNTAPPVLENKRAFKLKYDSNPTFTSCWLNPAFSTDFLGQSVIYSLHT